MNPRGMGGLVIGIGLTVLAASAGAQVRYVDGNGGVHWVQSEEQVPAQYRDRVETHLPSVPPSMPPAGDRGVTDRAKADALLPGLPASGIIAAPIPEPTPWQPPEQPEAPTARPMAPPPGPATPPVGPRSYR